MNVLTSLLTIYQTAAVAAAAAAAVAAIYIHIIIS